MYPVIDDPPLAGAVHDTVTPPSSALAETFEGAEGFVDGVIVGVDAVDRFPFPLLLVALTAKVYVAPLVRPVMVSVVFGDVKETGVWAIPASNGVMEYPVMGLPLSDGAFQEIVAEVLPGCAVTVPGTCGVPEGMTVAEGADWGPGPLALVASTSKV